MNTTMNKTGMEKTMPTTSDHHDHPPEPAPTGGPRPPRRVGLLDRVALHLGIALITWSRRPQGLSEEQRAAMAEGQRARLERERAAELFLAAQLLRRMM